MPGKEDWDELRIPGWNDNLVPKGATLTPPLVPESFYPLLGAVAAHWGYFELMMNGLLSTFVEADQSPDDERWFTRAFSKRSALLKKKITANFPGVISDEYALILGDAAVYHWQRNLVLKGSFIAHFEGKKITMSAEGLLNGRQIQMVITDAYLEALYHGIMLLTGRFASCTNPNSDHARISSLDKFRLREFLEKNSPNPSTPEVVKPQLPPWRG